MMSVQDTDLLLEVNAVLGRLRVDGERRYVEPQGADLERLLAVHGRVGSRLIEEADDRPELVEPSRYRAKLDECYAEDGELAGRQLSKVAFLADGIFDFTTYDGEVDELLGRVMLGVIEVILHGKTFEFQARSREDYVNYLLMVNMPFLQRKLNWGTSIRGAWFDEYGAGEDGFVEVSHYFRIRTKDLKAFMGVLLAWADEQTEKPGSDVQL